MQRARGSCAWRKRTAGGAELRRFSVVMMPTFSVFEKASPARQTGTGGEGMLEIGHRPHATHHWRPLTSRGRARSWSTWACRKIVSRTIHTQAVNRKLGPVDFCPPFITLLIVKVISLLEQFLSCQYLPDG